MHRCCALLVVLLACAALAPGAVTFHADQVSFDSAAAGLAFYGVDTFEEAYFDANLSVTRPGPIEYGVPNVDYAGRGFPTGLALPGLTIISTASGGNVRAVTPNYYGGSPLTSVGLGAYGYPTGSGRTIASFSGADYFAVSVDVGVQYTSTSQQVDIYVFDTNNVQIGSTTTTGPVAYDLAFLGIVSDTPIGRVEFAGRYDNNELIDNVSLWTPEPSALALMALGGFVFLRRR